MAPNRSADYWEQKSPVPPQIILRYRYDIFNCFWCFVYKIKVFYIFLYSFLSYVICFTSLYFYLSFSGLSSFPSSHYLTSDIHFTNLSPFILNTSHRNSPYSIVVSYFVSSCFYFSFSQESHLHQLVFFCLLGIIQGISKLVLDFLFSLLFLLSPLKVPFFPRMFVSIVSNNLLAAAVLTLISFSNIPLLFITVCLPPVETITVVFVCSMLIYLSCMFFFDSSLSKMLILAWNTRSEFANMI